MADAPVEPFVRTVTRLVGGPWGRHASRAHHWFNPATVAVLLGTVVWLLTIWRQSGCIQTVPGRAPNHFEAQCYSDIPVLFTTRGLIDGYTPYLDLGPHPVLEYPVLTGWLMELNRLLTVLFGAPVGPGLVDPDRMHAINTFYAVNMVVLFVLWLVTIAAQLAGTPGRGWDTLMLAAAPPVVLTGLINWDMLPLALTALGIMFWARRKPGWAGLFLGLSMAAKLYAGFLLGPLLLLCLRASRMREFRRTLVLFVVGWLIPNLPVMILAPAQWAEFWSFNSDRGGDLGSIWYVLSLAGSPVQDVNLAATTAFALGCLGVAALIMLAPRRPRIGQVMFLVLMAFLLTNKVYSPQYVLWILPFVALCRPRWRDWLIFVAGEWLYVMAIWGHLGQYLTPGGGGPDKIYWVAVLLRLATQLWLVGAVVRDVLEPEGDLVRTHRDDPSGGVLDGAPDAPWAATFRERVLRTPPGPATLGGVWLASRLLLLAIGVYAAVTTHQSLLTVLDNWDAEHYLGIAANGYETEGEAANRMAFFPGFPLLLAPFVALGLPGAAVGTLLSLVASAVAAGALYRLGGFWAAALWLVAPTAVFGFVPYTEALFCALAFWAWERARADRWWVAALLAAGACSVRVSGIFLVGALGIMILTWKFPDNTTAGERVVGWLRRAVWLVIPAAAVFAYAVYLFLRTGSWTAWYSAQEAGWSRSWTSPLESITTTINVITSDMYDDRPGWDTVFTFELVSFAVGLFAVGWLLRRRMWAEFAWVAVQLVAFSVGEWLFSVNRAVLLWFPVWVIAAELLKRRPVLRTGWIIVSVLTAMWWARMFYLGQWSS